jgi:hypothetical protein
VIAAHQHALGRVGTAPRALVPENDEMVLVGGAFSVAKTDLYRSSMGQPAISPANNPADSPENYCKNIIAIQAPFLFRDQPELEREPSPVPSTGDNLFTFMTGRLVTSYGILRCRRYDVTDPVRVIPNSAGIPVAASLSAQAESAAAVDRIPEGAVVLGHDGAGRDHGAVPARHE